MIDSLRVEGMLESAHRKITTMNMSKRDAIDLLTSWREMRAVVEALAADSPLECDAARTELWYCPLCSGESALDPDAFRHEDGCPYRRAVALVGSAGGTEAP